MSGSRKARAARKARKAGEFAELAEMVGALALFCVDALDAVWGAHNDVERAAAHRRLSAIQARCDELAGITVEERKAANDG